MTSSDSRVPGWIVAPIATAREVVGNNRRASYLAVVILAGLYATGNLPSVGIPSWWPAAGVAAAAAYFGGKRAAKSILELVPEKDGILLVEFQADDPGGGAIYELSEEAFEDMWIAGGDLYQWDNSPRRVYEVREYDPELNWAVGNWREAPPGSALASHATVDDALAAIRELREDLEPDAAEARELRRRIRGIIRELDKERAEAQQAILDDHLAPDLGGSRSIDEIVDEHIPDEIHPANGASERERPPDAPRPGPKENGDSPDDDGDDTLEGLKAALAGEADG
ncbi:hypothetical protein [Halapricum hydrolyticum]|uniref:DUF8125 domain-containing protein n=1 Tax=Halapricum hydrolyticum TaxID=2979991 RepID=A0AAE3LHU1_9EURY|nr:hypothetical protein [Halapricum hydrolyticum]MCU4716812.1 hypothetical protein [Halapricum hydrolyticum]MCU4725583.1 hypothetical protein [Halapricum hydrolyticum]